MGEPFVHRLRVRYGECDPQGVLFNANYLAYIDHTITELWRAAYGGYTAMLDQGVDIVVAEANLRFRGSARFDEEIAIEATVTEIGTTSVTTAYRFSRGREVLLEATVRHVFIDRATAAKTPMPHWARSGLEPWLVLDPGPAPTRP
jgi:acyl-CoA thioester hydrolase